jgi:hypothetical protein
VVLAELAVLAPGLTGEIGHVPDLLPRYQSRYLVV